MQTPCMSTTCTGCGASLEDGAPFCSQCGQTVVPAAIEQPFSAPPPAPPPPPFAVTPTPGFEAPIAPVTAPPKKSKATLIVVAVIVVAVLVAVGVSLAM